MQIRSQHNEAQEMSQTMLLKILSSKRFLAPLGLTVCGHSSDNDNFQLLLCLRSEDDMALSKWVNQKTAFLSHDVQNEYLQLMAHNALRASTISEKNSILV
jgi:hypothetical protein